MTWTVQYMRYHYPGQYEADTLREAIAVAMGYVDDGWAAPTAILGPDGSVAVDDPTLDEMYAADWGRIPTEEIVANLPRSAVLSAVEPTPDAPKS